METTHKLSRDDDIESDINQTILSVLRCGLERNFFQISYTRDHIWAQTWFHPGLERNGETKFSKRKKRDYMGVLTWQTFNMRQP